MIRAVLFDLDGTLLDRAGTLRIFLHQQHERFVAHFSKIDREVYVQAVMELDRHGHAPRREVYAKAGKRFTFAPEIGEQLAIDHETLFPPMAIPFPGLFQMLAALAEMKISLGLVTNGPSSSQRPKIEAMKISPHFGAILVSGEEGVHKPEAEIYLRAMQRLQARVDETAFVGDHPDVDIAGARALGIKTVWKRNSAWPLSVQPDGIIDDLGEIPAVISSWNQPQMSTAAPKLSV